MSNWHEQHPGNLYQLCHWLVSEHCYDAEDILQVIEKPWAEGCWSWHDIQETDTLNTKEAKGKDDTKHICPLQLEVYRRCILLYSDPGELVFEPFGGIGSGGYVALGGESPKTKKRIDMPNRYYCCEIKPEYIATAKRNLSKAVQQQQAMKQEVLF